ncbi:hypothetical protein [Caballeronia fortuita]|nr:hypothetical protein [Caballeronia fortuita]
MSLIIAAVCCASGAPGAIALALAVVAAVVGCRSGRFASSASTQSLLATVAFVAWALPQSGSVHAMLAGGALAALAGILFMRRTSRERLDVQSVHLACAGACAALAYILGAQSGALAVLPVVAMIALIGAHLALAMGGSAASPVAGLLSVTAACGLMLTAAVGGPHGALVVACAAIAAGSARSVAFAGPLRETP